MFTKILLPLICIGISNNTVGCAGCIYCDAMLWFVSVLTNNLASKKKELQTFIEDLKARNPTSAQNSKSRCPNADSSHCHKLVWNVFFTSSNPLFQLLLLPICTTNSGTYKGTNELVKAHRLLSWQVKIWCFLSRNSSADSLSARLLTVSPCPEAGEQLKAKVRELAQCHAQITGKLWTPFSWLVCCKGKTC